MKDKNLSISIILFNNGKMVISGMKRLIEAEQVVDKLINKLRSVGVEINNRKISIEKVK
jgi:TATA-box binding protein (TBP) (component of TFIID and TFIIIB)